MKHLLSSTFLLLAIMAMGQKSATDLANEKFDAALAYYQEEKIDSSLAVFKEIVEKKYDAVPLIYGSSFFNVPTILMAMDKFDEAEEWFKKLLESDVQDNDETGMLMEPHANYKHKSALALAHLAQRDSNYTQALHWLRMADTVYRYWGFEGSATNISKEQSYMLRWRTSLMEELGMENEAMRDIIIELICAGSLTSFFDNSQEKLIELAEGKDLKASLKSALKKLVVDQVDDHNWTASFQVGGLTYIIPISNVYPDRDIPHYWRIHFIGDEETPDAKALVRHIESREFFGIL